MKQISLMKKLLISSCIISCTLALTSCATVFNSRNTRVYLYDNSQNIEIYKDSIKLVINESNSPVPYITLDRRKAQKINIRQNDKSHIVQFESKPNLYWLIPDIYLFSFLCPISIITDLATKKWNKLVPNYLDIASIVGNRPMREKKVFKVYYDRGSYQRTIITYKCSRCGYPLNQYSKYCPGCHAQIIGITY
jgi:hypothetical protein